MTLATMMKLALRQLDEPAEDLGEYEELFRSYANMGYMIAVRLFYKPRLLIDATTDALGNVDTSGMGIARVVEVRDSQNGPISFVMDGDGMTLHTGVYGQTVTLLCVIECPLMLRNTDEPMLPEYAQPAIVDYICYRHLSSGNLAKQSRAEFFRESFYQQMRALRPQGAGSVCQLKNLYQATS